MVKCTFTWIPPALFTRGPFSSRRVIFQSAMQEPNSIRMRNVTKRSDESSPESEKAFPGYARVQSQITSIPASFVPLPTFFVSFLLILTGLVL